MRTIRLLLCLLLLMAATAPAAENDKTARPYKPPKFSKQPKFGSRKMQSHPRAAKRRTTAPKARRRTTAPKAQRHTPKHNSQTQ